MIASPSLFVLAGEPSADVLGGAIMREFGPSARFFGIGGQDMQAAGLDLIADQNALTIMGFGAALLAWPRLSRLANDLVAEIVARRPDAILTIDSKGFSLRFARRLKKAMAKAGWHAPIIHLVAPTVWAWGRGRAKSFAAVMDRLLCLFPFEPPYFTPHGLKTDYVGHPLFDRNIPTKAEARKTLGLDSKTPILVLAPGSRKGEIKRLLPRMIAAYDNLKPTYPALTAILPASFYVEPMIRELLTDHSDIRLVSGDSDMMTALAAGDAGIICSGTATLEAGLAGLPGVIIYDADWVSLTLGQMVMDMSKVVLANVLADQTLYPFLLAKEVTSEAMCHHVLAALSDAQKGANIAARINASARPKNHSTFAVASVAAIKDSLSKN